MCNRKGVNKKCVVCDTEFYVPDYRKDKAKFCSKECQNHKQYEKTTLTCEGCDKEFVVSESRLDKKFCNIECRSIKANTEKHRRDKIKALSILKRGKNSSRDLKKYISKIRPLCCENCGYDKASYNIEIHHIDENPNNNTLENLSVLCVMCHRDLHYGNLRFENNKYYYDNE